MKKIAQSIFKILTISLLITSVLSAQKRSEYFDAFYGGGIGYTPTFLSIKKLNLPTIPGTVDFNDSYYFHGVQGWGTISRNWRVGASVLAGNKSYSRQISATDTLEYAQFALTSSIIFFEYVLPISPKSQFAFNFGGGISNMSIDFLRDTDTRDWLGIFSTGLNASHLTSKNIPTLQPQVSYLWQMTQRSGLRINIGAQFLYISQTSWMLDDFISVSNASDGVAQTIISPYLQMFIYFGM